MQAADVMEQAIQIRYDANGFAFRISFGTYQSRLSYRCCVIQATADFTEKGFRV